jgi:tRNA 5-methylaminomethyl-2-thiouridine biosynthesis bifunctional protein
MWWWWPGRPTGWPCCAPGPGWTTGPGCAAAARSAACRPTWRPRCNCPPRHPLASGGYGIGLPPEAGGGLLCGATSQPGDEDPALRLADHLSNVGQWDRLLGRTPDAEAQARRTALLATAMEQGALSGRVGWRLACDDRLPLVGPVPLPAQRAGARRQEQPRMVPRVPGLYVLSALGSRGITLAPLLGEVLAAWITGAPVPLASSLMDAIDPARFIARAARAASRAATD